MARLREKDLRLGIVVLGLALCCWCVCVRLAAQFATSDRVTSPGFWPTQTHYSRNEYTGPEACATCHSRIFEAQQNTPMAQTSMRARDSDILAANPDLSFSKIPYQYNIHSEGGRSVYSISDGVRQQASVLVWAFGTNHVAQSYLFKKGDEFYESRVTYFRALSALDFTPGRALSSTKDIAVEEAMDRRVGQAEVYRCFACHTTASGGGSSFDEEKLIPGVTCEACHGPGRAHVAEMEGLPLKSSKTAIRVENMTDGIFDPKRLTPEESVDFCGACHGSYWDISLSGSTGEGNARFQGYRLEQSKCWNKDDARLTCVACHDPHQPVNTDAMSYDHVCLSCHLSKQPAGAKTVAAAPPDEKHPGAACPVAKSRCTSCHMPKVYVADMHSSFPDHRIRIAHEGDPFPE